MAAQKEIAKARILVLVAQQEPSLNYVMYIAAKLGYHYNYVSQLVLELEINGQVTTVRSRNRKIINNVDNSALVEAKKIIL